MVLDGFFAFAHRFKATTWLLVLVGLADLAGIVFGYYYYAEVGQFSGDFMCAGHALYCQPVWWWALVADSPNAVLLFFVAAVLYRATGYRNKTLDVLAFALNIYVGLWTTLLFVSYPREMGTYNLGSPNNILFVTHMGMPLQAFVLVQDMRRDVWTKLGVSLLLCALAIFVFVDYWGPHLHPAPFLHASRGDAIVGLAGDQWLAVASPMLMVIAGAAWLVLCKPLHRKAAAPEA